MSSDGKQTVGSPESGGSGARSEWTTKGQRAGKSKGAGKNRERGDEKREVKDYNNRGGSDTTKEYSSAREWRGSSKYSTYGNDWWSGSWKSWDANSWGEKQAKSWNDRAGYSKNSSSSNGWNESYPSSRNAERGERSERSDRAGGKNSAWYLSGGASSAGGKRGKRWSQYNAPLESAGAGAEVQGDKAPEGGGTTTAAAEGDEEASHEAEEASHDSSAREGMKTSETNSSSISTMARGSSSNSPSPDDSVCGDADAAVTVPESPRAAVGGSKHSPSSGAAKSESVREVISTGPPSISPAMFSAVGSSSLAGRSSGSSQQQVQNSQVQKNGSGAAPPPLPQLPPPVFQGFPEGISAPPALPPAMLPSGSPNKNINKRAPQPPACPPSVAPPTVVVGTSSTASAATVATLEARATANPGWTRAEVFARLEAKAALLRHSTDELKAFRTDLRNKRLAAEPAKSAGGA